MFDLDNKPADPLNSNGCRFNAHLLGYELTLPEGGGTVLSISGFRQQDGLVARVDFSDAQAAETFIKIAGKDCISGNTPLAIVTIRGTLSDAAALLTQAGAPLPDAIQEAAKHYFFSEVRPVSVTTNASEQRSGGIQALRNHAAEKPFTVSA